MTDISILPINTTFSLKLINVLTIGGYQIPGRKMSQ